MMMKAQIASVGFCPKLLRKMAAIGWSLSINDSRSVPMQKARAMLIAD